MTPHPCPFCGSTKSTIGHDLPHLWFVVCGGCQAHGPEVEKESEAIPAWNNRFIRLKQPHARCEGTIIKRWHHKEAGPVQCSFSALPGSNFCRHHQPKS